MEMLPYEQLPSLLTEISILKNMILVHQCHPDNDDLILWLVAQGGKKKAKLANGNSSVQTALHCSLAGALACHCLSTICLWCTFASVGFTSRKKKMAG